MKLVPAGAFDYGVEALTQRATGDTQTIDRMGVWFNQVMATQLYGIDTEIMGYFVEMHLYGIARLCRAMPALRPTRRLVGKEAHALEFVAGELICHGLQGARVIGRGDAIRSIPTTIEE